MRSSWEVWDPAGPPSVPCWPNGSSPPHIFTCLICGESYIYRVLRNDSSVHSVAVTPSCATVVLTISSSSSVTLSPFFFFPWERISWIFLCCHYASFLTVSLGFLKLFFNFPWASFATSHERGLASCLTILFWGLAYCLRTIWSEWTRSEQSPLACSKNPLRVSINEG